MAGIIKISELPVDAVPVKDDALIPIVEDGTTKTATRKQVSAQFDTLAAVKAIPHTSLVDGQVIHMAERTAGNGGGNSKIWRAGDKSAEVAADEVTAGQGDGGIWVSANSNIDGSLGAWEILFDGPPVVTPAMYGADPTGTTVSTSAVSAFFNSGNVLYDFGGDYLIDSTVFIPEGVDFTGGGSVMQGSAGFQTRFLQASGFNGDVFRVVPHLVGSRYFWFGSLRRFAIVGNTANSSGFGLAFRDASNNPVSLQNDSVIEDVSCRRMPSGGMETPDGALPLWASRLNFLYNNGPGITMTSAANVNQAIDLQNISGDGNVGGLVALNDFDDRGNVNIYNMKSEMISNPDFATGTDDQINAIVLTNCPGLAINIFGATHISAIPDGGNFKKPGSFIKVTDGNVPKVTWHNVVIRVRPGDTGTDPDIVETPTVGVPYQVTSGTFADVDRIDRTTISSVNRSFGVVDDYQNSSVEAPGDQIAGATPGRTLHETDAGGDEKTWLTVASGGQLTERAVNDSGVATIYRTVARTSGAATRESLEIPFRPGEYTTATLPAASANTRYLAVVSNPAASKGALVISDGAVWRYVSDDSAV